MSDRLFERALLDWLEDGSDRTPPAATDAVLLAIKTTPQQRGFQVTRRFTLMPASLRYVVATALVAVLAGGAVFVLSGGRSVPSNPPTMTPPTFPLGRIAFVRESGNGATSTDIWVMNADGSQALQLTDFQSPDEAPAWSPDGSHVAFVIGDTAAQIWIMRADGSDRHALTTTDFPVGRQLSWSPDGSQIVFADAEHGGLFLMNSDGTAVTRLTESAPAGSEPWVSGDNNPTWSPTGDLIAFLNNSAMSTIRPDGTGRSTYIPGSKSYLPIDGAAAWSPNGARFAVSIAGEIWLISETESYSLTTDTRVRDAQGPVWSPDGRWILFAGTPASSSRSQLDLFVINVDGSGFRDLLPDAASDYGPSWSTR